MTDIVSPPTISALPAAPQPADTPGEFDSKAFALLAAQVAMVGEFNSCALATQQNATAANERAVSAASSASTANGSASTASIQAGIATGAAITATDKAAEATASALAASKLNLGNKSTPPATDNQGSALLAGATYYDTTLGKWRVWTGAEWGDGISAISGVSSVAGKTGVVTLTNADVGLGSVDDTADSDKAVLSASKLTTARTINGVSFDGTANVAIPGNPAVATATGGVMDCSAGDHFALAVTGATTLSFSNIPAGSYSCVIELNHTSGAITLPTGTVWIGTAPTLATGKRHLIFFQRAQLGTAGWYASALPGFST